MGHLNSWKVRREQKEIVYENTRHCPCSGERSGTLVKAHRSWLSSTWHLAWFKQPILQKATELENLCYSLSVPAYSSAPPVQSLSISVYLSSPSCSHSLYLEWEKRQDNGWQVPPFACFPEERKRNKENAPQKLLSTLYWNRTDNCTITEQAQDKTTAK